MIVLRQHESIKENLEFDLRSLDKEFMSSEHVKIIGGGGQGETGRGLRV